MAQQEVRLAQIRRLVPQICRQDTAADNGKGWAPENPTFGHCAVVALFVQKGFGGELLRKSLTGTLFESSGSHYYNALPNKEIVDLTQDQFKGWSGLQFLPFELRTREHLMSNPDTCKRYLLFTRRLNQAIHCD